MKFWYKKYGDRLRPVIPITLRNKEKSIKYEALVDSGADLCFFHAEVGEYLGLDVNKGKKQEVFGIGGKVSIYYLHKITIEIGGCSNEIEAGFMADVAGHVMNHGILGQEGIFENFIIKFDLLKYEIELKERIISR